jgi:hypothetical protein
MNCIVAQPEAMKNRRPDDIDVAHQHKRALRAFVLEPEHQVPDAEAQSEEALATRRRGDRAETVVAVPFRFISERGECPSYPVAKIHLFELGRDLDNELVGHGDRFGGSTRPFPRACEHGIKRLTCDPIRQAPALLDPDDGERNIAPPNKDFALLLVRAVSDEVKSGHMRSDLPDICSTQMP